MTLMCSLYLTLSGVYLDDGLGFLSSTAIIAVTVNNKSVKKREQYLYFGSDTVRESVYFPLP